MKRFLLVFLQISLLASVLPAQAADFDANSILSDSELRSADIPMGFSQAFLESRGGAIAAMTFMDLDGSMKKPGDLIDYYARAFGVNPRYLLALIQKEQSLVDSRNPSPCQLDWATGYARPDGSTCATEHGARGFTAQIVNAAAFVECFYEDSSENCGSRRNFGLFPGVPAVIDGQTVIPANLATALLYSYTPHVHGNQNLVKLWSNWFSLGYPDGSVLKSPAGDVYLIQGGLKRRFANNGALHTRVDASRIIPVADTILSGFQEGAPIKFSDYTLVRVPSGVVYLLSGDRKRPVESMEVFRSIGFNPEELDDVTDEDLAPYAEGEPITLKSAYPTGTLLQDNKTGGVYFVENGVKRPIVSAEIMKINYPDKKISAIAPSALEKYPTAEPVRFRDGELVTSPGSGKAIFVISNGQRRPIVSGEVFEQLGYSWKRIIWTSDAALNLHPLGDVVTGIPTATGTQTASL
ncbi:MAG TPA: hypothetical protein VL283_04010 [Candidatus Baltobacteraceae bacterium]|nr:hypothetical protein [Candidatus Baltobacteraceae bacterium]